MVMQRPLTALLALFVFGCGSQSLGEAVSEQNDEPVANEARIELSEAELTGLKERAEGGDRAATIRLVDYYLVNYGDLNEDGIYWQLHAARQGDCEQWADLMFMEVEDGHPVPARFFSDGETLRSIGEASGCPQYTPRRRP